MIIKFFLLLTLLLFAHCVAAEDKAIPLIPQVNSIGDALTQGKLKALFRYSGQHRDSNLHVTQDSSTTDTSAEKKQQYSTAGGYLGYETAPWYNTAVGATVYTAIPIGNNPDDRRGLGGLYENDGSQDSYTVLGEAYAKYENNGHLVKVGRQEMPNYRFVSLSNVRMTPLTHEGAIYENSVFDKFNINLAYIRRMKERNAEKFIDMAKAARVKVSSNGKQLIRGDYDRSDYNSSGYTGAKKEMSMASLLYKAESVSLEGWNYYVNDFVNTVYLYGQYDIRPADNDLTLSLSAQYANQKDIGDRIAGDIDTWFYGLKFQAVTQGFTFFASYNEVDYNEDSYDGGTIFVRWGSPQMFNSFQVQDSELAGTQSYGIGLQYDFGREDILPGVVMRLRYADYDMPDSLFKTDARQDRSETTFDIRYSFSKKSNFGLFSELDGLSILLRIAFNDYDTDYNFAAYKQIHGYDFDSVTDDFVDARLYIDYKF